MNPDCTESLLKVIFPPGHARIKFQKVESRHGINRGKSSVIRWTDGKG